MAKLVLLMTMLCVLVNIVFGRPSQASHPTPQVMCKMPEVRGRCRALLQRWRYDALSGKCMEFKFGGCDGNENNFASEKACMAMCAGIR
ncbi:unnamed protein product [Acanthoscelides obtectus]|uniref:BPTI/Kunitz inhibitor domain-containing protein n=1 Tax=Acanthoscelides obtectus TaxID=200917 RepID=A0A9P0PBS4_ACAOB|nr:unnamed protein product [Acanthoscelides obtectus]CAK1667678.1 Protein AMBP [Acanthoscelides obtectus]